MKKFVFVLLLFIVIIPAGLFAQFSNVWVEECKVWDTTVFAKTGGKGWKNAMKYVDRGMREPGGFEGREYFSENDISDDMWEAIYTTLRENRYLSKPGTVLWLDVKEQLSDKQLTYFFVVQITNNNNINWYGYRFTL